MTILQPPAPDEIRAFLEGSLPSERFAVIDAWLASLPETEAERLLAQVEPSESSLSARPDLVAATSATPGFVSELPRGRLRSGVSLGAGGMATVAAAHDRVLERTVAVKVLRPRGAEESLEQYHLREAAFRREAALTAGLEHPAIPPVYDVGRADGLPAFVMKRLDGQTFADVVRAGRLSIAERLGLVLRVAEAVGYAHSRGVVHRDLTPANILVGDYGAVYVLDWGLAALVGTTDGVRAGTPHWMAPEQASDVAADPRMDVCALGALAAFALTGQPPQTTEPVAGASWLTGLENRAFPRGIVALIHRCLATDPAHRYADGSAVADDLRRWFTDGMTLAQQATRMELAWLRVRRSPRVRIAMGVGLVAVAMVAGGWWLIERSSRLEDETRLTQLAANTAIDRVDAVAVALEEVQRIARRHPNLRAAKNLEARFQAARDLAVQREQAEAIRARLAELLQRTRTRGPWADQVQAWRAAIRDAGLSMDPERIAQDAQILRSSPLQFAIMESLAFLWRAEKERGADHHAEHTAALLAAAGPTPAWQALGRLLGISRFAAHDPIFCACADSTATLSEAAPTAIALALFAPEPRLTAAARAALEQRPGDFWPLIASARASLADGDIPAVERLALIASGAEPQSVMPLILLSYAALQRHDDQALSRMVERGLSLDPTNRELLVLQAVALARSGRTSEAQHVVDGLDAGHLRYHLSHVVGHPMERGVQALVTAGLHIAEAPADLGPLTPAHHDEHQ